MLFDKKNLTKTWLGLIFIFSFAAFFPQIAGARIDDCSTQEFSNGNNSKTLNFPPGGGINTDAKVALPIGATITAAEVGLVPKNPIGTPYIWIPNSADGTLAQIRTKDGTLVKLYSGFSNPSRITLIPGGDVWVANRGNNYVTWLEPKIGSEEYQYGGQVDMGATGNRGITFDKDGNIWAGTYGGSPGPDRIKVICAKSSCGKGRVLATLNNAASYGMIGDKYGLVWAQVGGTVTSYKYSAGSITAVSNTSVPGAYGIGMDNDSNIWVGRIGGGGVYKITRKADGSITGSAALYSSGLGSNTGVAVSGDNKVWAAGYTSNVVSVFNTNGTFIRNYVAGSTPHGVAIDFDNNAWIVNMGGGAPVPRPILNPSSCTAGSGSVTKYKSDGTYVGTYTTCGNNPYNYSDMTGFRSIPTSMSIGPSQFFPQSGTTKYTGWESALQAALSGCSCPDASGENQCKINLDDPTKCDVPLSLFSVTGGTYEAKSLNIDCTTAVAPVLGGLIPCGRLDDNLATSWNETNPCNLCLGFLMLQNIVNWLAQIAVGIAVFILVIAGLLYVFSSGEPGKIELAKSVISYALIGLALVFIAWLLTGVIIAALGYSHPFTGSWNIVDCPIS